MNRYIDLTFRELGVMVASGLVGIAVAAVVANEIARRMFGGRA